MKCPICEFNEKDWNDVTKECKVTLKVTSTNEKLGYLVLEHNEAEIGSFDWNKEFTYFRKEGNYIVIQYRNQWGGYFKVFKRKGKLKKDFVVTK